MFDALDRKDAAAVLTPMTTTMRGVTAAGEFSTAAVASASATVPE